MVVALSLCGALAAPSVAAPSVATPSAATPAGAPSLAPLAVPAPAAPPAYPTSLGPSCDLLPTRISSACDGELIGTPTRPVVAVVVGGHRLDFVDRNELARSQCSDRPVHIVTQAVFDAVPPGPDPLYAAAEREVAVDRITPAPSYRMDCKPLYRADGRGPDIVFEEGFHPKDTVNGQYDVQSYVLKNQPSPYVSTTYDHDLYKQWKTAYNYYVEAPGGIDVNRTIGDTHKWAFQVEVAFPGGIDRKFIERACPVDKQTKTEITSQCVDNPHFAAWRGEATIF
ncbi:hypothetical protein GCM10012280_44130 [Wenjunlia tyrosinilytica]|uniref:Pierisin-like domain-containing protein n=2 Tax=Wenjunlia tyrosinilytica TaxID=1544741 RepID=A0A918DZY5_9ACTN|nr:hypothetical protein GCM10012280_44130 [Wenjunlia tyrosinilytica]